MNKFKNSPERIARNNYIHSFKVRMVNVQNKIDSLKPVKELKKDTQELPNAEYKENVEAPDNSMNSLGRPIVPIELTENIELGKEEINSDDELEKELKENEHLKSMYEKIMKRINK